MKVELLKYKHYLFLLSALLVANYLLVPLTEWQLEQQEGLRLLQKKQLKTNALVSSSDSFTQENERLTKYLDSSLHYLFTQRSEAEFKLAAQTKIEQLLQNSDCNISRIGFKGSQQVLPNVEKWHLEVRYKGDALCLLRTTRALETEKPYINIEEYTYNARSFDKSVQADFNATLKVSVWHKINADKPKRIKGDL